MGNLPGRLGPIGGGRLRGGILSAARVLQADYDDWRQGVTFNSACTGSIAHTQAFLDIADTELDPPNDPPQDSPDPPFGGNRLWYCTDPNQSLTKITNPVGGPIEFAPFLVYSERECSTWMPPDELEELARIGLDRTLSQGVAIQLQTNPLAPGNTSPSLNSASVDITPVSVADIDNTVSGLLSAICECGITELVFHAPIRSLPFFVERNLVEWDENRGVWHMGPHVFSFDCYSEEGPGGVLTATDGSEIWLYVTGPVEWALGPAEVITRPDSLMVRTNDAASLVEHLAIIRFDTCCVYASKAVIF